MFRALLIAFVAYACVAGAARVPDAQIMRNDNGALPLVIWHGMGDSCCAVGGLGSLAQAVEDDLGVFVHSIATGDSEMKDVLSSFWGSVNEQVATVCKQLKDMPELQGGFNMLGFSQGAQFLRAVVERCGHELPPVHTLVSVGGQHQGVMNVPGCRTGMSGAAATACSAMAVLLGHGAYAPWVRDNVVQAQYFKDPYDLPGYFKLNPFLADINNEREGQPRNAGYARNLAALKRLVLLRFSNDTTVVPRDSSWFSFFNGTHTLPLKRQPIYTEDWIGLAELDSKGGLVFDEAPGEHMQFTLKWFREAIVSKYLAGTGGGDDPEAARRRRNM